MSDMFFAGAVCLVAAVLLFADMVLVASPVASKDSALIVLATLCATVSITGVLLIALNKIRADIIRELKEEQSTKGGG